MSESKQALMEQLYKETFKEISEGEIVKGVNSSNYLLLQFP